MKCKQKIYLLGFSLMEIMIVLVVAAILVAVAIPSYLNYATKSRRQDAIQTLLAIQLAQEKWRLNNPAYGTLTDVWSGVSTTEGSYYNLAISNISATGYTLTATTAGSQVGDSDGSTSCDTLTLTNTNGAITKAPTACWGEG